MAFVLACSSTNKRGGGGGMMGGGGGGGGQPQILGGQNAQDLARNAARGAANIGRLVEDPALRFFNNLFPDPSQFGVPPEEQNANGAGGPGPGAQPAAEARATGENKTAQTGNEGGQLPPLQQLASQLPAVIAQLGAPAGDPQQIQQMSELLVHARDRQTTPPDSHAWNSSTGEATGTPVISRRETTTATRDVASESTTAPRDVAPQTTTSRRQTAEPSTRTEAEPSVRTPTASEGSPKVENPEIDRTGLMN